MTRNLMEKKLGTLLRVGIILSSITVLLGGLLYLIQHGMDNVPFELLRHPPIATSIKEVWRTSLTLTPSGIIQLGLLILVLTQLARVAVLFIFYAATRDNWYTFFCGFILLVLIYSFV